MQSTLVSKRITLVDKVGWTAHLEYNDTFAIFHLPRVTQFSKEMYKDLRRCTSEYTSFLGDLGYSHVWAALDPEDTPMKRLVSKLGFEYVAESEGFSVFRKET